MRTFRLALVALMFLGVAVPANADRKHKKRHHHREYRERVIIRNPYWYGYRTPYYGYYDPYSYYDPYRYRRYSRPYYGGGYYGGYGGGLILQFGGGSSRHYHHHHRHHR